MKKEQKKRMGILTALLLAVTSGITIADAAAEQREPLRCLIFYSKMKGVNSVIAQAADEMERELEDTDDIEISAYPLSSDLYSSLDYKVNLAIELDMDVLILSGTAAGGDQEAFAQLEEAGVKLILMDGDIADSGRCAYVGTDNEQAGRQGARLLEGQDNACRIGILSAPVSGTGVEGSRRERRQGFLEELEKMNSQTPDQFQVMEDMTCSHEIQEASGQIGQLLEKEKELNVLFCLDSASGIAAARAVEQSGKQEEVYVICFDYPAQVEEEMEKGGIDVALVQDAQQCGRLCVQILKKIKEHPENTEVYRKMLECEVVTAP